MNLCEKHGLIIRPTRFGMFCPKCLSESGYLEQPPKKRSRVIMCVRCGTVFKRIKDKREHECPVPEIWKDGV